MNKKTKNDKVEFMDKVKKFIKDKKLIKQQYNLLKINDESRKELKLLYYRNEYLIIKILCKVLEKIKEVIN